MVQNLEQTTEHRLQIHWAGGVHTEVCLPWNRAGVHRRKADDKVVQLVRELAKVCPDKDVAGVLNRLGYRTGQGNTWREARVASFRQTHDIAVCSGREGWMNLEAAARELQLSHTTVRRFIVQGILPARQVVPCAPWVIDPKDLGLPGVQAAARALKAGYRLPPTPSGQQELSINLKKA